MAQQEITIPLRVIGDGTVTSTIGALDNILFLDNISQFNYKGELFASNDPFPATTSRSDYDVYYVRETITDTLHLPAFTAEAGTYICWINGASWHTIYSVIDLLTFVDTISLISDVESAVSTLNRFDSFYVTGTVDISDPITGQSISYGSIIWWDGDSVDPTVRDTGEWGIITNVDVNAAATNYYTKKYLSSLIGRLFGPSLIDNYPGFVSFVQAWLKYCDYSEDGTWWQYGSKLDTLSDADKSLDKMIMFFMEQYALPVATRAKAIPYFSNYKRFYTAATIDISDVSVGAIDLLDESQYWKDPSKITEGVSIFDNITTVSAFYIGSENKFYSYYFDLGKTGTTYNRGANISEVEYSIWNGTDWTEIFPTANDTVRVDRNDTIATPTYTYNHFRNSGLVQWAEEDTVNWDSGIPLEIYNSSDATTDMKVNKYWLRVRPKTVSSPTSPKIIIGKEIVDTWDSYNYTNMRFFLHYARKFAEAKGTIASFFFLFALFGGTLEVISAPDYILTPSSGRVVDSDQNKPVDVLSYRGDTELPLKWPHIHGCETEWKYNTQNDYAYYNTDYVDYTHYTVIFRCNLEKSPYKALIKDLACAAGIQICWVYDLSVGDDTTLIDENSIMTYPYNPYKIPDEDGNPIPDPGDGD